MKINCRLFADNALYASLPEDELEEIAIQAEAVVVGGGLAGLTAACNLADLSCRFHTETLDFPA